jgi:hypothetical protein
LSILGGLISGGIIGLAFGFLTIQSDKAEFFVFGVAAVATAMARVYSHSVRLLRSLPWSLNRCAAFVWATYLIPVCVAVAALFAPCTVRSCTVGSATLEVILPAIGLASLLSAAYVHTSMMGTGRRLVFMVLYLGSVMALTLAQQFTMPLWTAFPIAASVLAVALLAISFLMIRFDLATRTLGLRPEISAYGSAA